MSLCTLTIRWPCIPRSVRQIYTQDRRTASAWVGALRVADGKSYMRGARSVDNAGRKFRPYTDSPVYC